MYHPIAIGFEKIYATDARIEKFICASVANTQQNKTTLKPRNFKLGRY